MIWGEKNSPKCKDLTNLLKNLHIRYIHNFTQISMNSDYLFMTDTLHIVLLLILVGCILAIIRLVRPSGKSYAFNQVGFNMPPILHFANVLPTARASAQIGSKPAATVTTEHTQAVADSLQQSNTKRTLSDNLKYYFLSSRTQKSLKKTATYKYKRQVLPYAQAKNIGILFGAEQEYSYTFMANLITKMRKEGKNVSLLGLHNPHRNRLGEQNCYFIGSQDVNLWGEVQSKTIEDFANTEFDHLYCFCLEKCEIFEHILAHSKAHCRIGAYQSQKQDLFEIMLALPKNDKRIEQLIEQALCFTQAIGATNQ